jgi:hypothetical protein
MVSETRGDTGNLTDIYLDFDTLDLRSDLVKYQIRHIKFSFRLIYM